MNTTLSPQQEVQEREYSIPYHYIPTLDDHGFSQVLHWSWGMRYLAGLERVLVEVGRLQFSSLLDIGCGDGRFLREVAHRYRHARLLGVDYSPSAVALARALNPDIDYVCADITSDKIEDGFDLVTMVEVLEHIPLESVDNFLAAVARLLNAGGKLVMTVPHANKRLQPKHYQHFSSGQLGDTLAPYFIVEKIVPFDRSSRLTTLLGYMLGGDGANFVVTNRKLNGMLYRRVKRHCLEPQPEHRCGRLLAVARRRS